MKNITGYRIGEGKETIIGNNCFIGMNAIILMGTKLGNNTIVGAGSVVHGFFPDNVVIAGNPARVVCSMSEHIDNRKRLSLSNAKETVNSYVKHMRKMPNEEDMKDFVSLFSKSDHQVYTNYSDFLRANIDK